MAKVDIKMPDEFLERMSRLGKDFDTVAESVLEAGGEVVLQKVQSNLSAVVGSGTKYESRSTGELESALGLTPVSYTHLEPQRIRNFRYPLVEWGMTEADCLAYCKERGFDWDGLYDIFHRVSLSLIHI